MQRKYRNLFRNKNFLSIYCQAELEVRVSESCNCGLEATGFYKQGHTYVFISEVPNKLIRTAMPWYCLRLS